MKTACLVLTPRGLGLALRDLWRRFGPWPGAFRRVDSPKELRSTEKAVLLGVSDRLEPGELTEGQSLDYQPPTLAVEIGCRRGTIREVIRDWVDSVMFGPRLMGNSPGAASTVMLKVDEPGLIESA